MRTNRLALITALALTVMFRTFRADEPARLLIHHIGPAVSTIQVANFDGTGERPLVAAPSPTTTPCSRLTVSGWRSHRNAMAPPICIAFGPMALGSSV